MKRRDCLAIVLITSLSWFWPNLAGAQTGVAAKQPIQISVDCRNVFRKLMEAEITLPIQSHNKPHALPIWYPKWVPGSHGPGGPIANIAGLQIRDSKGELLSWNRTPGEVYRIEVNVPAGENQLKVFIRYIVDQPTTNSFGHDCFASAKIGLLNPSCLLWYPEGSHIDKQLVDYQVRIPAGWKLASALTQQKLADGNQSMHRFEPVSLRRLVDSPIMFGKHYQSFDLVEQPSLCPPHRLHVFGDEESTLKLNDNVLQNYRAMVTQTARLIGSHPFDRFDILLGITDQLPKNGLEHSRSTMNVLPPAALKSPQTLKGWDRLLVPHEYLHAWCGKFRRPAGMLTTDFHTRKDTELLWVYEGLTQYLGELVEARSGMMSEDEFRHRLLVELRNATHQQGRRWRTLADTAAASHILRDASPNWSSLRRSQDYYMEGMLFWLEADAILREQTDGKKSLDDFCHQFFVAPRDTQLPKPFDRREVVQLLGSIAKFDWDGLISRRIESYQQQFDPSVAQRLGYKFVVMSQKPEIPSTTFRHRGGIDLLDSLGMTVDLEGTIGSVLMDSIADRARLVRGLKIIGVDGKTWSPERLVEAVKQNAEQQPIKLLVAIDEHLETVQLHHYEGLRYWNLVRDESRPDRLAEILEAN